jgi:hypothetical protein
MPLAVNVEVSPRDREVLASWTRSPSVRAGLAQRARIVLLAGDGLGTNEIVRRTRVSKPTVIAWKRRYAAEGIGGLEDVIGLYLNPPDKSYCQDLWIKIFTAAGHCQLTESPWWATRS